MSVELIKKPITLDEMPIKESVQVIKERDIIVPDGKPDMQSIVQLDGKMNIDQIDVTQDRIMYRGKVNVCILYTSVNNPKCVYTMKGTIPIEDFVILEGVNKDQKVDFDYEIEHMSYNILNERKVNVKAIIKIDVEAKGNKETTVATAVKADEPMEIKEEKIKIVSLDGEKEDKVVVKEDLTIPQAKPCVGEILLNDYEIQDEQVKRTDTEVKYNGVVEVTTMYKACDDEEDIEIIKHKVPFEGSMECVKSDDEKCWNAELSVEPSYMQVTPDYDGEDRIIECEFIVGIKFINYNQNEYDIVTDVYCPGHKIKTKEKTLDYMNLKNYIKTSIPKKEAIPVEAEMPENTEVYSVEVMPTIEEKTVDGDKLTLKGTIEMKTTCLNKTEEGNTIDTSVNIVPFTEEIEVGNMPENAVVVPTVTAKETKVYSQTKKELVIEYLLDYLAEIYTEDVLNVLEEIDIEDMTKEEMDNYPSMTIYQVKKGDTLWALAKQFNTTVKDIQELNDIEIPENLQEGQKIIILKKVRF